MGVISEILTVVSSFKYRYMLTSLFDNVFVCAVEVRPRQHEIGGTVFSK